MKKTGFVIFILLTGLAVYAQDPAALVSQSIEAMGGADAVGNFTDYEASGTIKVNRFGREMTGDFTIIRKGRKIWTRSEMTFRQHPFVMIRAYDGEAAFSDRQGTIVDMPALNYESDSAHMMDLLIAPDAKFSLGKAKELDGKKVLGVEVMLKGKKTIFFIDLENQLPLEIVFEDQYFGSKQTREQLEKRIRYGEWKTFSGFLFPSQMTFYEEGRQGMEFLFDKVTFKPKVPADRFARPDQELDLRYRVERMD